MGTKSLMRSTAKKRKCRGNGFSKKPATQMTKKRKLQSPTAPNRATKKLKKIPIHSLSSKEEKRDEFDRRMKRRNECKEYSVPLNPSFFENYERSANYHQKIR